MKESFIIFRQNVFKTFKLHVHIHHVGVIISRFLKTALFSISHSTSAVLCRRFSWQHVLVAELLQLIVLEFLYLTSRAFIF